MNIEYIIGIDIGGTWIRVALCSQDLDEKNIKIKTVRTPKNNKFSISNAVCGLILEILNENNIKTEQLLGIGLATAGPINMKTGDIFNNVNLGFKEIPLRTPIQSKFPNIPIYIINDCRAAVLGVHYFEAKKEEKDNLVYITMSTGIGGGVICNGHLLLGKEGNAAEVGHGKVDAHSTFQCNCGAYGCWEVYSSGTGVKKRALDALKEKKLNADILMDIINNDVSKITAKEIFHAAREGDELSKEIVNDCIYYSKVGIGLVNNYYDCKTIYFGGAMMNDKDQIIPPLIRQFEEEPILFTINNPPKIKITNYKDEIGIRGALVLVKYRIENNSVVEQI
jgi:glucokinase